MKGRQVPADAQVQIRLDFLGSGAPIQVRNKAFLASQLDRYLAWGHAHGVPLLLGEFGLFRPCFENDRGGLRWVEDMVDLAAQAGLSFTYHAYHEDGFGLYRGDGVIDPSRANQPLIDLFTRKLAAGDGPPPAGSTFRKLSP
jgi:endoglucanase